MQKNNLHGLGNIMKQIKDKNSKLFTKSRILFLIVVFIVFLMPLVYRKLTIFLM